MNKYIKEFKKFKKVVPDDIAKTSVEFFKGSFKRQGFHDTGLKRWTPNKYRTGRKILIKSGKLRDSIKAGRISFKRTVIYTNVSYAGKHNYGTTKIPQRQFMGKSKLLNKRIKRLILNDLKKRYR